VTTPPIPPITPEFRAWAERERGWGRQALRAIARQRGSLLSETHGLERFTIRMALVDLTGSVAKWGDGLCAGLEKVGLTDGAALFAIGPPFAATDPTIDDCDQLGDYVEARVQWLEDFLGGEPA
jgi:hypothetical protein